MGDKTKPIAAKLFSPVDSHRTLGDEKLRGVLLDQYKLYVEMADRISARRQNANRCCLVPSDLGDANINQAVAAISSGDRPPLLPAQLEDATLECRPLFSNLFR